MSENINLTYYQRNQGVILNRTLKEIKRTSKR